VQTAGEKPAEPTRIDRSVVGRRIGTSEVRITAEATRTYALATNDKNPAYLDAGDVIAPPMYQVVLAFAAMPDETMAAYGLDVLGTRIGLHAEQDMRFLTPIRPEETIVTEVDVEAIEDHRLGEIARFAVTSRTINGEERCRATWSNLYVDDSSRLNVPRKPAATDHREPPLAIARMPVSRDQSLRYAEASGDHTRTHVDEEYSQSWGYPTYLLQGLCTMAFAGKAVIDELAAGDPSRLRRLRVRFAGPVFPGNTLSTAMWEGEGSEEFNFETTNEHGAPVIAGGIAEL
jgi:acyl dehydratase